MMEDQMGDDAGMASGAPTPLTALEVRIASSHNSKPRIHNWADRNTATRVLLVSRSVTFRLLWMEASAPSSQ